MDLRKTRGEKISSFIAFILTIAMSIGTGLMMVHIMLKGYEPPEDTFKGLLLIAGIFYIIFILGIIVHEAGHLIFGLLSGYEFISFRVGKLIIYREGTRLRLGKYQLKGTGGQCLLGPPEYGRDFPWFLYNLGGGLLNLIFGLIYLFLYLRTNINFSMNFFLGSSIIVSFYMGLTNLLPMRLSGIANDGYNIYSILRDRQAEESFYKQLKINQYLMEGASLGEVPEELFSLGESVDLDNPLNSTIYVYKIDRHILAGEFLRARQLLDGLENKELLMIHKMILRIEDIFLDLVLGQEVQLDKTSKKLMDKTFKKEISALRTRYAYEKLEENNLEKASKSLEEIYRLADKTIYKGIIRDEEILIDYIDRLYETRYGLEE